MDRLKLAPPRARPRIKIRLKFARPAPATIGRRRRNARAALALIRGPCVTDRKGTLGPGGPSCNPDQDEAGRCLPASLGASSARHTARTLHGLTRAKLPAARPRHRPASHFAKTTGPVAPRDLLSRGRVVSLRGKTQGEQVRCCLKTAAKEALERSPN
jgi:hypothetical protein